MLCPWIENLRMLQESNNDALKTDTINSQNLIDNINNNSETQEGEEVIETLEANSTSYLNTQKLDNDCSIYIKINAE